MHLTHCILHGILHTASYKYILHIVSYIASYTLQNYEHNLGMDSLMDKGTGGLLKLLLHVKMCMLNKPDVLVYIIRSVLKYQRIISNDQKIKSVQLDGASKGEKQIDPL